MSEGFAFVSGDFSVIAQIALGPDKNDGDLKRGKGEEGEGGGGRREGGGREVRKGYWREERDKEGKEKGSFLELSERKSGGEKGEKSTSSIPLTWRIWS